MEKTLEIQNRAAIARILEEFQNIPQAETNAVLPSLGAALVTDMTNQKDLGEEKLFTTIVGFGRFEAVWVKKHDKSCYDFKTKEMKIVEVPGKWTMRFTPSPVLLQSMNDHLGE